MAYCIGWGQWDRVATLPRVRRTEVCIFIQRFIKLWSSRCKTNTWMYFVSLSTFTPNIRLSAFATFTPHNDIAPSQYWKNVYCVNISMLRTRHLVRTLSISVEDFFKLWWNSFLDSPVPFMWYRPNPSKHIVYYIRVHATCCNIVTLNFSQEFYSYLWVSYEC
jgi:hypothetical protein